VNPLAVSELTRLGSSLLKNGFNSIRSKTNVQNVQSTHFENELKSAQKLTTPTELEAQKVELLKDPALSPFLKQNSDNTIHLDKLADGSMRLVSSSGDFLTLSPNSEICQKASQFHSSSLNIGENITASRPNSVTLVG